MKLLDPQPPCSFFIMCSLFMMCWPLVTPWPHSIHLSKSRWNPVPPAQHPYTPPYSLSLQGAPPWQSLAAGTFTGARSQMCSFTSPGVSGQSLCAFSMTHMKWAKWQTSSISEMHYVCLVVWSVSKAWAPQCRETGLGGLSACHPPRCWVSVHWWSKQGQMEGWSLL